MLFTMPEINMFKLKNYRQITVWRDMIASFDWTKGNKQIALEVNILNLESKTNNSILSELEVGKIK